METEGKKTPIITRIEAIVAILAGLATFIAGFYTIKKDLFKGKGTIAGIVKDFKTRLPVAEVKIEITDPGGQLLTTIKSDINGEFSEALSEGSYIVKIVHPSYEPQIANINITSKETSRVEIDLIPLRVREASRMSEDSKRTEKDREVSDTLRKKALETGLDILKRKL